MITKALTQPLLKRNLFINRNLKLDHLCAIFLEISFIYIDSMYELLETGLFMVCPLFSHKNEMLAVVVTSSFLHILDIMQKN